MRSRCISKYYRKVKDRKCSSWQAVMKTDHAGRRFGPVHACLKYPILQYVKTLNMHISYGFRFLSPLFHSRWSKTEKNAILAFNGKILTHRIIRSHPNLDFWSKTHSFFLQCKATFNDTRWLYIYFMKTDNLWMPISQVAHSELPSVQIWCAEWC